MYAYDLCITNSRSEDPLKVPEPIDIHLHLPAGAQKKDGPSAGVAMVNILALCHTTYSLTLVDLDLRLCLASYGRMCAHSYRYDRRGQCISLAFKAAKPETYHFRLLFVVGSHQLEASRRKSLVLTVLRSPRSSCPGLIVRTWNMTSLLRSGTRWSSCLCAPSVRRWKLPLARVCLDGEGMPY